MRLIKWTIICGGTIAIVNAMGLAIFLYVNQQLDWRIFLQLLLSYLMLEGLVITLIGCVRFFGFRKYIGEPREKAESKSEQTSYTQSNKKADSKLDFGTLFLILGMSLFLLSFIIFSFLY